MSEEERLRKVLTNIVAVCYQRGDVAHRFKTVWDIAETALTTHSEAPGDTAALDAATARESD